MGIATHLGPWLLGTVKDTSGATAGTVRNIGVANVSQNAAIGTAASNTLFYLPAGSMILGAMIITTTGYSGGTSPTLTLSVGGTAYSSALTAPAAAGVTSFTVATTGAPLAANVGTSDVAVTCAVDGAPTGGAGVIVVQYAVRLPDGTYAPTSYTA